MTMAGMKRRHSIHNDMREAYMTDIELPRMVPPNPEAEGYHWIRRFRGGPAIPLHWNPTWWHNADRGWGVWGQPDRESKWEYLGPCPPPICKLGATDQELMAREAHISELWQELLERAIALHRKITRVWR